MWEDVFEVWEIINAELGRHSQKLAGEMSLNNALLFMKAWMEENYADQYTSLELRRQVVAPKEDNE